MGVIPWAVKKAAARRRKSPQVQGVFVGVDLSTVRVRRNP
jgi:hypothetical protein